MPSQVVRVREEKEILQGLRKGAEVVLAGGLVAVPTESFYGLAVNAMDEHAIRRLFSVKNRDEARPLLILLPNPGALSGYVQSIPKSARLLIERFWPGGLTLVFFSSERISPLLTAGTGKIGVRLSSHPIAAGLARIAGVPLTGTSANLSGQLPCNRAEDVRRELGEQVDLILDGGETQGGRGSTVLDVTASPPKILREGMVSAEVLQSFIRPEGKGPRP